MMNSHLLVAHSGTARISWQAQNRTTQNSTKNDTLITFRYGFGSQASGGGAGRIGASFDENYGSAVLKTA
jgi:hypothetical protein